MNEDGDLSLKGFSHFLVTVSLMAATVMQSLDMTIANVALPRMQGALAATQDEMGWVLTSYIIAAAIMLPLTGWLAGRFGRKRILLLSILGFTISSALCAASTTLPEIVAFRFLQGASGAALVPLSQAVLFDINPREKHGSAMAVWGIGVTIGPILGPMLGGWLTDDYSWHWVFLINLPVGAMAMLGVAASMPETKNGGRDFDFFGFVLLAVSIGAFQLFLDRGQLKDWFHSTEIVLEAMTSLVALYCFLVHSATIDRPFLRPALFLDRNFVAANLIVFLIGAILFATLALLPPMLQNEMGYPAMRSGFVMAPRGVGSMIGMIVVGRMIGKIESRLIIGFGLLLTAIAQWQMTKFDLMMGEAPVVFTGIVQGLGVGFVMVPLSTMAFDTLPPQLLDEGTTFYNLMRNIGSSIGISVVNALLIRDTQVVHSSLVESVTPFIAQEFTIGSRTFDLGTLQGMASLDRTIGRHSAMIAYLDDFRLMMLVTLAIIPLLAFLRPAAREPEKRRAVSIE